MTSPPTPRLHSEMPSALAEPNVSATTLLKAENLHKSFVLHGQGGVTLPVLTGLSLQVHQGECVALVGASGSGKSTLMRSLYGNYRVDAGSIWVRHRDGWVDLPQLQPHELLDVRKHTMGYVSQFLRVIPRVAALDVAAEPMMERGVSREEAIGRVEHLFTQLNLPKRLWSLSPTTFSGGEKQRVNIARAFAVDYPMLLLDEPTSALDALNREVVIQLIEEKKAAGCALIGIFHDEDVRDRVCNRQLTFDRDNS
ncbi:MAG: phosphonate C-P lyase system protein PhnL [Leptolyngbyaceae bacterium]|nr:phosphonate C-P lyase system protein PhnL [Leptolyngbyaceae bacterium]